MQKRRLKTCRVNQMICTFLNKLLSHTFGVLCCTAEPRIGIEHRQFMRSLHITIVTPMLNTCGIKLCLSNFNGYSHYLNQSILCKSIPVISDIETHRKLTNCDHFVAYYG